MKNRFFGLIIILVTFIFSCKEEKKEIDPGMTIGALHISKSKPSPGDSLFVKYEPLTVVSDEEDLHAYYTYFVADKNYSVDIELVDSNGKYSGGLKLPDSANALIYHFKTGDNFEANEKKGYSHALYDSIGNKISGSATSLANFKTYMAEYSGIKADKQKALAEMTAEIENNPKLLEIWEERYFYTLLDEDYDKGTQFAQERIETYSQKEQLTDKQYGKLVSFYRRLEKQEQVDSITKIAVGKFPNGKVAERVMIDEFFQNRDPENQKKVYEEYIKVYGKNTQFADFMVGNVITQAAKKNDLEAIKRLTQGLQNSLQSARQFNNVAWNMAEENKNLEIAEQLSKKSLDILEAIENTDENKPDYQSQKQYADDIKGTFLMNVDTYAYILFKIGKKEEALKYQLAAIGDKKVGRPDVNERYIQFLLANDKEQEALKEASRFIKINKSTPKIKKYLRQAYFANTDMKGGFDDYLKGLENEANEEALAELKEKMLNEEPFEFTLKNMKGEEVTLSELKGKTVIMDFWATWCGPCTKSFPGMQEAVNKYKDDPNVVFLFIDTLESGTPEEIEKNVGKFIAENNYSFNVLFDKPVKEGSRNFVTTKGYNINGIPTKIIVGPDGRVKFRSVGYMGSPDQLVQELDLMIGLLKT